MSNEYFDTYSALPRFQNARAEAINAIIDAIIVGFDNVPSALSIANAAAIANGILATVAQWAVGAGAVNATTGAYPTAVTSLTDGLLLGFRANLTNTSTVPTFKADGMPARTITRNGGQSLAAGDIQTNGEYLLRYNLANTRWELMNPTLALGVEGTVVAASSVNLATSGAPRQALTGNTTITGFVGPNMTVRLRLTGAPQFTYNAASLITPTGANVQGAPGDIVIVEIDGSNNATIVSYLPFGGVKKVSFTGAAIGTIPTYTQVATLALTPGKWRITAQITDSAAGADAYYAMAISPTAASIVSTTVGDSYGYALHNAASGAYTGSLTTEITMFSSAPIYLNCGAQTTTPSISGSLRAERIL